MPASRRMMSLRLLPESFPRCPAAAKTASIRRIENRDKMKRTTCIALGSFLAFCLLLMPAIVYAHAQLLHTEPANGAVMAQPPERVRLFFSEPIERDFFALEVYTQNRVRVDRRDAQIAPDNVTVLEVSLPRLAAGTYTVSWRALSIDGHVVNGTFSFSVGAASTTQPLLNLATGGPPFWKGATERWLTFLAAFVLIGGFGFLPLILGPTLQAADFDPAVPLRRATRGLLWTAWPAVVLLLVLSLVVLLIQSSEVTSASLADA